MLHRICNRCGADALTPDEVAKLRNVAVPHTDPATLTPPGDITYNVGLTLGQDQDVCAICCSSLLLEYSTALLGTDVVAASLKAQAAQVKTVGKP